MDSRADEEPHRPGRPVPPGRTGGLVLTTALVAALCATARAQATAGSGAGSGTGSGAGKPTGPALEAELRTFVRPFVQSFCAECHSGAEPEADLDLTKLFAKVPETDGLAQVLEIRDALAAGDMPPEDEPAPEAAERERMLRFLRDAVAVRRDSLDPGRVTMRRLSRAEYRNTVRDLFGIDEDVTGGFPADDLGYGFDNIGEALSVSTLHIETYAAAARRIAELAIDTEDPDHPPRRGFEVEDHPVRGHASAQGDVVSFHSRGTVEFALQLPRDGDYLVRVRAFAQQAGDEPARMAIGFAGESLAEVEVPAERSAPGTYERRLRLRGGAHPLSLSFVNDYFDPKHEDPRRRDRNLHVDWAEVVGPLDRRSTPEGQRWILAADPGEGPPARRAKPILAAVMRRAWRRPARPEEVARTAGLVRQAVRDGDSFAAAIQLALQAILVSPNFLFRIEPGGRRTGGQRANPRAAARPDDELLDDHAIATRLSYFLWSSAPDQRLMDRADKGELRDPDRLAAEARRLLADPRADALATNFAAQWLELRSLEDVTPDRKRFPGFTPALRQAMRTETELFFLAVLREQREVYQLIDADFTFVNQTLAAHYGIAGVEGEGFRRVQVGDGRRGGLLGQASIQTVTSNPTRTSPVKRGKWILDNLLDDPPPPPEPGSDNFKPGTDVTVAATLRAELANHRKSKACAVCHDRMDPLGLALENYDAIGRWRETDHGARIDANGELPDGRVLDGPAGLRRALHRNPALLRCLAKKLFLYGVGRELRGADLVVLEGMVESLGPRPTLTDMVLGVVGLPAFRRRLLVK